MKLLYISHSHGQNGGAEKASLEDVQFLTKNGIEICVVLPKKGRFSSLLDTCGIRYRIMPYGWAVHLESKTRTDENIYANIKQLPKLSQLIQQERPDAILTATAVIPWFAYVAKKHNIPHIWSLHELVDVSSSGLNFYPNPQATTDFIQTYSDALIVNSHHTKGFYKSITRRTPTIIVYPQINQDILSHYKPLRSTENREFKMLCLGSILPIKNQLEVVKAIQKLQAITDQPFHLNIVGGVGNQDYLDKIMDFIEKHQLQDMVSILPHTDAPYDTINTHDISIIPSTNESFGRVAIESMALGRIAIGSNVGGNIETIGGYSQELLYKLGDSASLAELLKQFIENPPLITEASNHVRTYAKNFIENNIPKGQQDLLALLRGVAEGDSSHLPLFNWVSAFENRIWKEERSLPNELHHFKNENIVLQKEIEMLRDKNQSLEIQIKEQKEYIDKIHNSFFGKLSRRIHKI